MPPAPEGYAPPMPRVNADLNHAMGSMVGDRAGVYAATSVALPDPVPLGYVTSVLRAAAEAANANRTLGSG